MFDGSLIKSAKQSRTLPLDSSSVLPGQKLAMMIRNVTKPALAGGTGGIGAAIGAVPGPDAAAVRAWPVCAMALLCADFAAIGISLLGAILLCHLVAGTAWPVGSIVIGPSVLQSALAAFLLSSGVIFAAFGMRGHYHRRLPFWGALQDIVLASVAALLWNGFFDYVLQLSGNRRLLILTWLLFPVAVVTARRIARRSLTRAGLWQIRTLIVGEPGAVRETLEALRSEPDLGYEIVGTLDPAELVSAQTGPVWRLLLAKFQARLVVIAGDAQTVLGRRMAESLVRSRISFAVVPPLCGMPVLGFEQTRFFSHDTVMFAYRNNLANPVARFTKLSFDVSAALVCLILLLPLFLVLAVIVKLDGGPALFAHTRLGANGRPFRCLKFRSMVRDADAVLERLLASDKRAAEEWAATQKLLADPRITWIGRFLRATSLDELPQLLNVLRLEMSLVGPRPIVFAEVARYGEDIAYYYETRPGITGLWQVSGRSTTSYAKRVQLDTWYVKNWTLWHDLAILAKTVPALIERRGAC